MRKSVSVFDWVRVWKAVANWWALVVAAYPPRLTPSQLATLFIVSTACALTSNTSPSFAAGPNLITNGSFESGNTGFTSGYTYSSGAGTPTSCYPGYLGTSATTTMDAGCYAVVTSANSVHNAWTGTPRAGSNFLVANGSSDSNDTVWRSSSKISVTANSNYRFKAQLGTLYPVNSTFSAYSPQLTFQIGDGTNWVTVGTTTTFANGTSANSWIQVTIDGSFDTAGDYYVRLRNNQTAAGGNDLGLDDVQFYLEPAGTSTPVSMAGVATGTDTTPPTVTIAPANGATGIALNSNITISFNESVWNSDGSAC